jgi:trimeric autotransporter adhesin
LKSLLSLTVGLLLAAGGVRAQIITTIAGSGMRGYAGNGDAATTADLFYPTGMAIDNAGNIFFADQNNNRIRRISSSYVITTYAGGDTFGYSGDGHVALAAALTSPTGVALDADRKLYIADYGNHCIRMVDKDGLMRTFAGTGEGGFGGDGGPATAALLNNPISIVTDKVGNVYIADHGNNRVRKVDSKGIITTIAGSGADGGGNKGDGGPATAASFAMPTGIALDKAGNLFIADAVNGYIREVTTDGIMHTVAGNGYSGYNGDGVMATAAKLFLPWSIAIDQNDNLYIADQNNNRVRKVNKAGIISTYAGIGHMGYSGDGGCANAAELSYPWGVAVDGAGSVYISDWGVSCIRKVSNISCDPSQAPVIKKDYELVPNADEGLIDIIQGEPEDMSAAVKVMNAIGKSVYNGTLTFASGKAQLVTNTLPSGIYIIELQDAKGRVESFRVMLEN